MWFNSFYSCSWRELDGFLVAAMEVSGEETELEGNKLKTVENQLDLILLARPFSEGECSLVKDI